MAHEHCMLDTWEYKSTLRICNTYCLSTATVGTRIRNNILCILRVLLNTGIATVKSVAFSKAPVAYLHAHFVTCLKTGAERCGVYVGVTDRMCCRYTAQHYVPCTSSGLQFIVYYKMAFFWVSTPCGRWVFRHSGGNYICPPAPPPVLTLKGLFLKLSPLAQPHPFLPRILIVPKSTNSIIWPAQSIETTSASTWTTFSYPEL